MSQNVTKDKLNFDITNPVKKRRVERSTIGIILFTAVMFGVFFGLIAFSLYTRQRESYFLRQVGVNLTGDLEVYSSNQGNNFLLNERNAGLLAKATLVGKIRYKTGRDTTSDKQIVITSITNDDEAFHRYMYIDCVNDGEAMVTIVNENGSITAILNQTKYSSYFKYITEETNYGKNKPVDSIP